MIGEVKLITGRDNLPLRLEDVKQYLKVNSKNDDFVIDLSLKTAADAFESWTNKVLITQTYMVYADKIYEPVQLRKGNFQALTKVEYLASGVWTEYDLTNFSIELGDAYPVVRILMTAVEPLVDCQNFPVRLTFTAGFGDTYKSIPSQIAMGLLQLILFIYQNRGDYDPSELPMPMKTFFNNHKIRSIGCE